MQGCRETGLGGLATSGARCIPLGKGALATALMLVRVQPRAHFIVLAHNVERKLPAYRCG